MSKTKLAITFIVLQIVAVALYPPSFFDTAPQAAVLPPSILLLLLLALIGVNTGTLDPEAGVRSLNFVQGLNIIVRLMMFFPNLKLKTGQWDIALLIMQLVSIGLSWYLMVQFNNYPPSIYVFTKKEAR